MKNKENPLGRCISFIRWFIKSDSSEALRIRRYSKIAALIVFIVILLWIVPFNEIVHALLTADPLYMTVGLLLGFFVTFMRSLQLGVIAWKQGINLNVGQLFVIDLIIKFYLLFLPTSLIGSGMRWYKLAQADGKSTGALATVTFNRLFDTFLIIFMGSGFILLSGQDESYLVGAGLAFLTVLTIIVWFVIIHVTLRLLAWMRGNQQRAKEILRNEWVLKNLEKLLDAFSVYAEFSILEMISIIVLGVIRMLVGVGSFYFLALSVKIDLSFVNIGWVRSIVLLASLLPFSIAGGLGIREVSLVALLSGFGIGVDLSLAYSFLLFARGVLIALVGGVIEAIKVFILERPTLMDAAHNDGKG